MRTAPASTKPTLAPLRAVSDTLDVIEVDLESVQRDLVLAERVGMLALVAGALAVAGIVTLVVVRSIRRRRATSPAIPEAVWPPVPLAPDASEPPAS